MRVVYFSHSDGVYGAPKSLIDLIEQLRKEYKDYYPIVVTSKKNELNNYCDSHGIENYNVYYTDCIYGFEKQRELKQVIHDVRVYVKMNFRYHMVNRFSEKKISKLIDFTSVDLIHSNVSTIDMGYYISKKYNIPHVWHVREYGKSESYSFLPYSRRYYDELASASRLIYISRYVEDNWKYYIPNKEKATVVYDVVKKVAYKKTRAKSDKVNVLFSGSSTPAKGIIDLVDAISQIRAQKSDLKIQVDVYGDYNNEFGRKIKKRVAQNSLDNVISFKGFDSSLTDKMTEYDIGIVGSRSEAFGRITIEYMSAGLFIIATDSGANPELLEMLESKKMYRFGEPGELAQQLINTVEDTVDWDSIRKKTHQRAMEINNSAQLASQMMKIYSNSIGGITLR